MFNSHKIDGNTTLPEVCNLTFFKISQMLYGKLVVIVLVPRCYRGVWFLSAVPRLRFSSHRGGFAENKTAANEI